MPVTSQSLYDRITESAAYISARIHARPSIGIILGSGLGGLAQKVQNPIKIPYLSIPHFPKKSIRGHGGELVIGTLAGKSVIIMSGRFHYYQGYNMSEVVFPIYVLQRLGISSLIVTNAAGGLPNKNLVPGDLMLIRDHINEMGTNPLIGYEEDPRIGPLFVPMTHAYDALLMGLAISAASQENVDLKEGIYVALSGPSYETKAEVRKLALYADAVGMSTVPELIISNQLRLPALGISCITNVHNDKDPPTHEEVLETGKKVSEKFQRLLLRILLSM